MMDKFLPLLLTPTLAFALHMQGPDEEDLADDQAKLQEQVNFYQQFGGDFEVFRKEIVGLSDRYEAKKRERFEQTHGGSENFVHSWDEDELSEAEN